MKRFWAALAVLCMCISMVPGITAADAIAANQYVVNATVAPSRFIIVNRTNQITEIISNTPQLAQPEVYISKVVTGNERALTPQIYEQYLSIMTSLRGTLVGIIYHPTHGQNIRTSFSYEQTLYHRGRANRAQKTLFLTHLHTRHGPQAFTGVA